MNQNYQKALHKSWKVYATSFEIIGEEPNEAFKWVFKRAYQLGKQEKDAEETKADVTIKARRKSDGEIIEVREWSGTSDVIYSSPDMNHFWQDSELDFNVGSEDTVIQGWVARDEDGRIYLYENKPERENGTPYCKPNEWVSGNVMTKLNVASFPDLTWDSEPETVEIIIKRKNSKQE